MTAVQLSLIVAASENGVIGRDGGLPWRLSSDLKTFRRLTMDKPIVMGRRTFQSIGKVLDGRDNIVVTRDALFSVAGVSAVDTVADALVLARTLARTRGADEIMVIGGAQIYAATLPLANRVYLTRVHAVIDGDTFFPELPEAQWREVSREALPRGPRDDHAATLVVYDRIE